MAEGKWIEGLTPGTPAVDAARTVLAARIGVVRHYFPLAVHGAGEVENVHQLRVSSRRAAAALRLFRPLAAKKPFRRLRKTLRLVRQAAGAARDWDVFLELLRTAPSLQTASGAGARDFLAAYSLGCRALAQREVAAAEGELGAELESSGDKLPDLLASEGGETLGQLADETLTDLLFVVTTAVERNPKSSEELHALRIVGKRLRYAMELFADCYAPEFRRELYPAVEELQESLGRVQDGETAQERLATISADVQRFHPESARMIRPAVQKLKGEMKGQAERGKKAYRAWAKQWLKLMLKHPLPSLALPPGEPTASED